LQKENKVLLESVEQEKIYKQEADKKIKELKDNCHRLEANSIMVLERMNLKKMSEHDTVASTETINDSRKRFRQGRAKVASMADITKEACTKPETPEACIEEITLPRRNTVASLSIMAVNSLGNRVQEVKSVKEVQISSKKQMEEKLKREFGNKNNREFVKPVLNVPNKRNLNFKLESCRSVNVVLTY
jgi:hypothetical protein